MGYYSNKEIASVVEPDGITLANNPNFVVFSSKGNKDSDRKMRATIQILQVYPESVAQNHFKFEIKEKQSGDTHDFKGTYDKNKISSNTFFVPLQATVLGNVVLSQSEANQITLQNIKECLLKNSFFRNNFDISIPAEKNDDDDISINGRLEILSKGAGIQYDFEFLSNGTSLEVTQSALLFYNQHVLSFVDNIHNSEDIVSSAYWLTIKVTEGSNVVYNRKWNGTTDPSKENQDTYLLVPESNAGNNDESFRKSIRNVAKVLNLDSELLNYVDVVLDDYSCTIKDKFSSDRYIVEIEAPQFSIQNLEILSSSSDTIDYGTGNYQIELEVYTDHQIFPGNDDSLNYLGNYLTTLSKSYFGKPLWFDLSTLLSKKVTYSAAFLSEPELDPQDEKYRLWSDAQTITDYRFIAKRTDGKINQPFYYSSPLYVLNGYDYTLNPSGLEKDDAGDSYILDFSQDFYAPPFTKVKPLTTRFNRTHIKGQKQYFNFIYHFRWLALRIGGAADPLVPSIGLHYKLYTQSGAFIGEYTCQGQEESEFSKVNTALLRLDEFLPMHNGKTVGRIDVYLCRWHKSTYPGKDEPEVIISTPLSFRILPEDINEINDFVFLNRLGGWDTMNFGGGFSSEFKTAGSTIYKTLQSGFTLQSEIESVAMKSVQEQKIVQTSPVTTDVVEWLREMSASPAVYELKTKRYIIVDDMSLKYNSTDDLYQVEMKYHYTDTFK
ncbi:hypothetical protein CLV62_101467 [Dysgonomonas alginatilytica]|uniref:Uncharacterized protein n=1 Tax=Dysgonomonas alginatilytica TaxID=1605892 RepID=A0A2V3PX81_9BACT|nr:hypothetical protein [Dysgonomonas alginatilytica]PXV69198.1 hypothetical protein CLV62_101467 [Dysgonomonas alginatilytica]